MHFSRPNQRGGEDQRSKIAAEAATRKQVQEIQKQKKQRREEDILVGEKGSFVGYNTWDFKELPIVCRKRDILYCVEKYSCVIVVAETGSGKTTKIPQYLVEGGYALYGKRIGVTQPRRIAAISIANRVSQEMGCILGQEVGYSVRFDEKWDSELTQIKYMTDGMLLNEVLSDPLLTEYSVLVVDDIHERTLNTDILLALLRKIRKKNPTLKLVISSATIDAEAVSEFFTDKIYDSKSGSLLYSLESKMLFIEGRQFPVDIYYLQNPCKNYVLNAVQIALEIHNDKNKKGDVLVFLTSQEEITVFIEIFSSNITSESERQKVKLLPLYSGLSLEDQMDIFKPIEGYCRKVIVSTNIAESSITIDGVVFVIDSLFVKTNYYDYRRGLDNLLVVPVSKSNAKQRAGRAGRVQRGECYRLATADQFNKSLFENSTPEILRAELSSFILQVKTLGVGDVSKFELVTYPHEEAYAKALEQLYALKVIDNHCNLTSDIGLKITDFNLETKLGVLLLNSFSDRFGCSAEALILCSMLSLQNQVFYSGYEPLTILKQKKRIGAKEGDHITLINVFLAFRHLKTPQARASFCGDHKLNVKSLTMAMKIHEQLSKSIHRMGLKTQSSADDIEGILRCLVTSLFMNVAQLQPDGSYRNLRNREILYLHPTSILNINFPKWVIYSDVVFTSKYYMREVSEVDPKWLLELAPHYFQDQRVQQAQQRHGRDIIAQSEFEAAKVSNKQIEENSSLIGRSRIFKRKGGIDTSIREAQETVTKKMKINLPSKSFSQKSLLSFNKDDDEDEQ